MAIILLVEPDMLLAGSVCEYLTSVGHKVQWQSSAQSAVNSADETVPDIIILELQLAGHSGIEFLYELRSYPEWQAIPVIVFSSLPESEILESSVLFGPLEITAYHHKQQTTLEQLENTINKALKIKTR